MSDGGKEANVPIVTGGQNMKFMLWARLWFVSSAWSNWKIRVRNENAPGTASAAQHLRQRNSVLSAQSVRSWRGVVLPLPPNQLRPAIGECQLVDLVLTKHKTIIYPDGMPSRHREMTISLRRITHR